MRVRKLAIVSGAFVLVLVASACGGGSGSNSSNSSESGGSASGKVEVEMDDYYFEPKVIKGEPGDTVTLELKNEGSAEHNFELESQGIDQDVEAGGEAEVDVTIPESGSVEFYCKFHESQGMEGKIESGSSGTGSGSPDTTTSSGGDSYGSG
jgi:plastocyanin